MTAWSYSSIKTFDQCPKKYFHLRVAKDVVDTPGPEADYGTQAHAAAEAYIRDGTPVPSQYEIMRPLVERLAKFPGDKYCELKLGVRLGQEEYEPCDFFDRRVWYRGIIDLLIIDGNRAWLIDYKTGKNARYADTKQLDLMAGAVFVHFPEVQKIKAGLAFVVSDEFPKKNYERGVGDDPLGVFSEQLDRLDAALANGVWNPKTSGLCSFCPVETCEHWRPRRR